MTVFSIQTENLRRHVASGLMLKDNNCLSSCHRLRGSIEMFRANEVWMFQVHHNHEPTSVSYLIHIMLDRISPSQLAAMLSLQWILCDTVR
jgi:hypothetical protein